MRMNYIARIQAKLTRVKTIYTKRATSRILDGSSNSIYKGRRMNFEELREYVPGDDVKDIDWKASSRSPKTLVRQYIAEKKHNLMIVLDTNRRMLADTDEWEEKRDVAIMAAGMIAYLMNRNGDYVGACFSNAKSLEHYPFRTGLPNIENILNFYHKNVTAENRSNIETALSYIAKNERRRMIIALVTDYEGIRGLSETTLRRILLQHDLLVIVTSDMPMTGKKVYDVAAGNYVPAFLSESKRLGRFEKEERSKLKEACEEKMKRFGIAMVEISNADEIDREMIALLEQHKSEKR